MSIPSGQSGYDPKLEPYKVKKEGHSRGQCPAIWVFRDPKKLRGMIQSQQNKGVRRGDNRLYDYMIWVRERSELLAPTRMCPHCGIRPVEIFSVLYNTDGRISVDTEHTSCQQCRYVLESQVYGRDHSIYPLNWNVVYRFSGTDRKNVQKVLDWAFEIPSPLSAQVAHDILRKGDTDHV